MLEFKKIRYIIEHMNIDDFSRFREIYEIYPNGIIKKEESHISSRRSKEEKSKKTIISVEYFIIDIEYVQNFISDVFEVISNSKEWELLEDDSSGRLEITFYQDSMKIIADRFINNGYVDIVRLFFKLIEKAVPMDVN